MIIQTVRRWWRRGKWYAARALAADAMADCGGHVPGGMPGHRCREVRSA